MFEEILKEFLGTTKTFDDLFNEYNKIGSELFSSEVEQNEVIQKRF